MANEYISREAAKNAISHALRDGRSYFLMLDLVPAADVVTREAFNRILAENDDMREQLAAIGKKPGDKMDDVRPVVRAFWVGEHDGVGICSNCNRLDHIDPLATHCRYCGADVRGV